MEYPTKEFMNHFLKGLRIALPDYFRLYSKLLEVADPITHEINDSLQGLAKRIDYNIGEMKFYLISLSILEFIIFPRPHDDNEKITLKTLVQY